MLPTSTVFLPGAGGRSAFWRPVGTRLVNAGHATFFGWPGFGDVKADPAVCSLGDLFAWLVERLPDGPSNVVAQSMGGVLAMRLALDHPSRVDRLILAATSGGIDVRRLGADDWRRVYRAELGSVPDWFVRDRTNLEARLGDIRARSLLVFGDADPLSPVAVGEHLRDRIPGARLVVVRGGTHALAEERAEEVAGVIDQHLA